jgi:hypothetical protein
VYVVLLLQTLVPLPLVTPSTQVSGKSMLRSKDYASLHNSLSRACAVAAHTV